MISIVQEFIDAAMQGAENAASLTRMPPPQPQPSVLAALSGNQLLVVEDEAMIALELAAILEAAGLKVVGPARSIKHAHKLIAAEHVDAALLDVNVAGQRIDDLAVALSRDKIPFAFLTGYGRENLPVAFADASLVAKPFKADQVIATVRELLAV
jgi:DNA-binding response OmpR family regulator